MKSLPDLLDMEMQLEAALIEVRAAIREQVNRANMNKPKKVISDEVKEMIANLHAV